MGGPHNFLIEITLTLIGALMAIEAVPLLRISRKSGLHYAAAAFDVLLGAFTAVFGFSLVAPDYRIAEALNRLTELMSIVVMPLFLQCLVLLTARGGEGRRRYWHVLMYLPAAVLAALSLRGSVLYKDFFIDERGVWNAVNKTEGWAFSFYWIYAIACFLAGLCFLVSWRFRAAEGAEKRLCRVLNRATAGVLAVFCINMAGNLFYFYRNSPWRDFAINLVFTLAFYAWIVVFRRTVIAMTGGVADAASAGFNAGGGKPERIRKALVAMFAQPVLLLDRELRIEHCNQAAASLFAAQGRELRGRLLGELLDEPGSLDAVVAGQEPESRIEARAAGGDRGLELSFRAVLGEAGLVAGYVCQCAEAEPSVGAARLPYGEDISSREYEVLFLLAEGLDVDDIAGRLFIAPSTVKSHIHHLYQKTGARNRVELARLVDAE